MSDMVHFKKWSLVRGHVHATMNLTAYGERLETAQWWLGNQVLQGCRALMPLSTGNLQQRSASERKLPHLKKRAEVQDEGRRVVFPGPYARYLYMGVVMVNAKTGKGPRKIPVSPGGDDLLRFPKGAKLKPTNRRLTYSNPEAVDHWFDEAKARNLPYWLNGVENFIKTGRP
ncbi:MAG: hypothetical protein IJK52_02975 [Oscillospiraceae bacterium]|nr:hypothetical protein [Oscillospiraceae bacterium]